MRSSTQSGLGLLERGLSTHGLLGALPPIEPLDGLKLAMRRHGRGKVLNALEYTLNHGDEDTKAWASAVIRVLICDEVMEALFDPKKGILPKFEVDADKVLAKLVSKLGRGAQ